jgi:hypothetical protein
VITITPEKKDDNPASPPKAATRPAVKEQAEEENPVQPSFTDFGLYKCEPSGKMVMGFEKEKHVGEAHQEKETGFKKLN